MLCYIYIYISVPSMLYISFWKINYIIIRSVIAVTCQFTCNPSGFYGDQKVVEHLSNS